MKPTGNKHAAYKGFTLAEIMTVVAVITLLLLIALPSIATVRTQLRVNESKAILNLLGTACNEYKNENLAFPDSAPGVQGGWSMEGRHRLVEALVGYMDEADDGHDGFGWSVVRGKVHGPYNGTEEFDIRKEGFGGNDVPVFTDAFDNYVYYWRFNGTEYGNDNSGYFSDGTAINDYAKTPDGSRYYRDDFLLATKGADGVAERITTTNVTTDDITNFLEE